jgi:hypothetical protein
MPGAFGKLDLEVSQDVCPPSSATQQAPHFPRLELGVGLGLFARWWVPRLLNPLLPAGRPTSLLEHEIRTDLASALLGGTVAFFGGLLSLGVALWGGLWREAVQNKRARTVKAKR